MRKFFNTVYAKISIIFLLLLLILGTVQIFLSIRFSSNFFAETDQKLNRNLAADLAKTFKPFLKDSINYESIEHSFHDMMVMNPRVEFYLIDDSGNLLAYFAEPEKIKRMKVTMEPVKKFLSNAENLQMPLLGDDPRSINRKKPISVAPVNIGKDQNGFLYVILGGEQYDSALAMLEDSYIFRTSAVALIVNFVITALVGLILFFLLTKRIRTATRAVHNFEKGNYDERISSKSHDEIGHLATAFNKMADKIKSNMEEIEKNDRLRRDLIANISHDLRSPLASVQGYLETILMKEDSLSKGKRREYLETVCKNIERLNKLVYELLELSKLDAGQIKPKREPFSIAELTQDVMMKYKPQAEKNNIIIDSNFSPAAPIVEADIGMIERAISNLLENALNYTSQNGKIFIELSNKKDKVTFSISDTGNGIAENDLPYVFDRFYRADKSRSSEGTGLGLAITKKILEAHNSSICVQSKINQGTTFTFELNQSHI